MYIACARLCGVCRYGGNQRALLNFMAMMADPEVPMEEKKGIRGLTEQQQTDIAVVVKGIPDLEVVTKVQVDNLEEDDEQRICQGDAVSIIVTMTRRNVEEGEEATLV